MERRKETKREKGEGLTVMKTFSLFQCLDGSL